MDLLITGVSGVAIVEVLVKVFKPFFPNNDYLPLLNVGFGLLLSGGLLLATGTLNGESILTAAVAGVMIGATASGLYDIRTKTLGLSV